MSVRIAGFIVTVPDLAAASDAWERYLAYRPVREDRMGRTEARLWGWPQLAGAARRVLAPGSGRASEVHLVAHPGKQVETPFRHPGWNAAEIVVADVDTLHDTLADSPFHVLGPPAELSISEAIRAMQVVGPGGELLYLTQIKAAVPGFELPMLESGVGHCFVAILGAARLRDSLAFYRERLGAGDAAAVPARVQALSLAFEMDRESRHEICAPALAPGYLLEIDQMPASARARPLERALNAGIAGLLVDVDDWPDPVPAESIGGIRNAAIQGPDGETLLLREAGSD